MTPWQRVIEKLTVIQLVKKLPTFMEPESSLLIKQEFTTGPYPAPYESSRYPSPHFRMMHFNNDHPIYV
jgi:hypothetical protein